MRYLLTVPAAARRTSPTTFAVESAFAQHLRELKDALGARFDEIVVAMANLSDADWEPLKDELTRIDEAREHIRFVALHTYGCSKAQFARESPALLPKIAQLVRESDLIHSHFSYDIFRPIGAWFCCFGVCMGKRVIAIEDIDRRKDAEMFYRTGRWSLRNYLTCKYLYDPLRDWLQRAYVRNIDMMLFKELQQVRDFGRGADHVRLFLDPNFSDEHVVDDAFIARKCAALSDPERPLRVLYFGRLVPYKGVDRMLEAVALAHRAGARIRFDIMGAGEQLGALRELCNQLGISHLVHWIAPRAYGPSFFEVLRERDLLLACPLSGDTPRSAWDALASGMPLLAFDTPFYRSMAAYSNAVEVTPWPEVEPLAARLAELAHDKQQLAPLVENAARAARENSGKQWLERRVRWVDELFAAAKPRNLLLSAASHLGLSR
jgi:glycosyltransferase involved in cell wall biosynthesis